MYTNEVYVKDGHWAYPMPVGSRLAEAVLRAAQLVIDSGSMSGAGLTCLGQFLAGLHDVVSVEAHTDEGGFCRDLLRHMPMGLPSGVLGGRPAQVVVFPAPAAGAGRSLASYAATVDCMAIASAAMFAVSDPGVRPGSDMPTTSHWGAEGDWHGHQSIIMNSVALVGVEWVRRLGMGCGVYGDGDEMGSLFSAAAASIFEGAVNRHLEFESVHPWFWIEPTCILTGTAESVHYSAVCKPVVSEFGAWQSVPLWSSEAVVDDCGAYAMGSAKWVAPRECGWWYLYSPYASPKDGAAGVEIVNSIGAERKEGAAALRDEVLSPGEAPAAGGPESMLSMGWKLGSCGVPPPAMARPTTNTYYQFRYATSDFAAFGTQKYETLSRFSAMDGRVKLRCSKLQPMQSERKATEARSFKGNRGIVRAAQLFHEYSVRHTINTHAFEHQLNRLRAMVERRTIPQEGGDVVMDRAAVIQIPVDGPQAEAAPAPVKPAPDEARAGLHAAGRAEKPGVVAQSADPGQAVEGTGAPASGDGRVAGPVSQATPAPLGDK